MAFVFDDQPGQAPATSGPSATGAGRFVFDDAEEAAPIVAVAPAPPVPVKPRGILQGAVDTFAGAGARVAQGVNESLGAINNAFGLESTVYKEGAEYWNKKAEESGSSGLPAQIYQGVGAAPAGVAEFIAGPVYAGAKGAVQGYREDGIPGALEKAAIETAKRVGIGKVFHGIENTSISGLPKAAVMGGTMGVQTAAEGGSVQDIAAATITGAALSVPMEGGQQAAVRRNLLKEGVQPEIASDLAGRVQNVFPETGKAPEADRFVFEAQPTELEAHVAKIETFIAQLEGTSDPALIATIQKAKESLAAIRNKAPDVEDTTPKQSTIQVENVATGDASSATLDPERQSFIKDKVEGLGSVEATDKMHPTDSPADVYARQTARDLFETPVVEQNGAIDQETPAIETKPVEASKTAPGSPNVSEPSYIPSPDTEIKGDNAPPSLFLDAQEALGKEITDAHAKGELTPELVQEKMKGLAVDRVTDFQGATFHRPTLDLAWNEHQDSGRDFSYGDVDLANLGGLNAHTGSNEKSNPHFRVMSDIVREEVLQDAPGARFFRHGGDEFSIIAPDTPRVILDAALARARDKVSQYAAEQGLDQISHPKHKAEAPHAPGIGIYYGTSDFIGKDSIHGIITEADGKTSAMKKQKGADYVTSSERQATGDRSSIVSGAAGLPGENERGSGPEGNGSPVVLGGTQGPGSSTGNRPGDSLEGMAGTAASSVTPPVEPLTITYHPDKKMELRFSEAPTDQKTINRLATNGFKNQGNGVFTAQGDGKARRAFVEKLQGEVSLKADLQKTKVNEAATVVDPVANAGNTIPETVTPEPAPASPAAITEATPANKPVEPVIPVSSEAKPEAVSAPIEKTGPPTIEPGAVEQFTATTRKRGGQDIFDVKLNPSQRRTLEAVRQEISDGEAGKRVGIYNTNEPGSTQIAWGSSFPEYFKDRGYTKKQALLAIDNILNGDGVTAKQRIMVEDMHQAKRQQDTNTILNERAKPSEVSALSLNEGDSLKRNGEKFKVTDISPDGVTLKDGVALELNHKEIINYDRGTLKDADGKQKRASENSGDPFPSNRQEAAGTEKPRFEQTPAGDQGKLFATPPAFGKGGKPEGRHVSTDELPLAKHSIQDREGKQAEMFPHNGGVILDSMGLQQIYERITSTRLIRDVMEDVKALGRHVFAKGGTEWKTWFDGMKETLGKNFAKVRPVMEKVWKTIDNERGSVNIEAPRLREAWDGILRAINPMERGELAQKTGELLRERMGVREMNRVRFSGELDTAVKKYEEQTSLIAKGLDSIQNSGRTLADRVFNKMNEEDSYAFMQALDTGDKAYFADKPALNDIAAVIDSMFQAKVKEIQNLGTGAMDNVRDSYFPHIWEKEADPAQIAKIMGRRPLEGSKGFTKQRVFEDIQAGLDAGYKPISQNPLDLVFLKMGEMDKYISAHKGLQAMVESGLVQLVPAGEKAPDGFHDIAGKYGIVTKQADQDPTSGMPGEMKSYRYVAVDEVAQVFNNYLSQSLYNNQYIGKPFEAYMGVANTLNQFQLGVGSLFHGGFTSLEAVISRFSLGLKTLSTGDLKGAAEYFATSPVAMVSNWKLGQKVLDAMKSGKAPQGEMADIMDWLQLAGARTAQDERFRTDQTQKVLQAWSNGKHFGAVAHSPLAVVEQSSRIILEHIVPQQKMGVFVEMMKQWTDSHPAATHAELRTAAQSKWSRADARLGQVVYERYFIHNAVKNGLQALIRAPGWTGGTIFELGGGTKDALESIIKLSKGEKTELSDRTAYAISLVTVSAIANGLATLFLTGDMPKGMDFLAFRTGNLDEKGKPERFVFPTYMKDLYAYTQKPATTLLHKAHPVIGLAGDIITNQDYYGTELRHPGDNPAKQVFDTVFHTAKAFTPFWMRGVAKERERGGSIMAQVAPFFGVMPAPADMNATAAEKKARELVVGKLPKGSKTKEQFEKSQLEHKIENALRKKDPEALAMIRQAKRDKIITPKDEQEMRKAANTPPLVSMTRSLDFDQALQVWEEASDQEKGKLKQSFVGKGERYREAHPDQAPEINKQLRVIRRFVWAGH